VLPTFTTRAPGPQFSPAQLAFAGVVSLVLWVLFVLTQTGRHRDFFLTVVEDGPAVDELHAARPSGRTLVLTPETLAAVRAAQRNLIQTSLDLAYGSAMASIGLPVPAIAVPASGCPVGEVAGRILEEGLQWT
jgi:Ca2+:H+ antiporter